MVVPHVPPSMKALSVLQPDDGCCQENAQDDQFEECEVEFHAQVRYRFRNRAAILLPARLNFTSEILHSN